MPDKSFIARLLSGANPAEDRAMTLAKTETPAAIIEHEVPHKQLAIEHAYGVIVRALDTHHAEEARLLAEINEKMEELRQVRVTLAALDSAYTILHADRVLK